MSSCDTSAHYIITSDLMKKSTYIIRLKVSNLTKKCGHALIYKIETKNSCNKGKILYFPSSNQEFSVTQWLSLQISPKIFCKLGSRE